MIQKIVITAAGLGTRLLPITKEIPKEMIYENLGDIGEHFPNTPEYLNISSIELLRKVVQKMPENTKIINVDTSIVLNTPKISPHKNAIKKSLSEVLGVSTNNISIKGTTTNNLGFVDMSNGWGAQAILTIDDGN